MGSYLGDGVFPLSYMEILPHLSWEKEGFKYISSCVEFGRNSGLTAVPQVIFATKTGRHQSQAPHILLKLLQCRQYSFLEWGNMVLEDGVVLKLVAAGKAVYNLSKKEKHLAH